MKRGIDNNIVRPLIAEGKAKRYKAKPVYEGKSFVPIALDISAGPDTQPEQFHTRIAIWGRALDSEG